MKTRHIDPWIARSKLLALVLLAEACATGETPDTSVGGNTVTATATMPTTGMTTTGGPETATDATTTVDPTTGMTGMTGETTGPAPAGCGDGVLDVDAGEECDDGEANADDAACTTTCAAAVCGDGLVQAGVEACDDGNANNADACLDTCVATGCGDGKLQAFEDCDDGNMVDTDECLSTCMKASCGDGQLQDGVEQCDDGNLVDGDGCSATCEVATCGDGVMQAGEECDDANMVDTDACLATCKNASCGDGVVQAGVEQCDDANADEADGCAGCKKGVMAFGEFRPALACAGFVANDAEYRRYCFTLKGATYCTGNTGGGMATCTEIAGGVRFTFDFNATWPMRFNNNQAICANYHPDFIANFGLAIGYGKTMVTQTKSGNSCTRTWLDANGAYQTMAGDAGQAQVFTVDFTN